MDSPYYLNLTNPVLFKAIASAIDLTIPFPGYGNPQGVADSAMPGKLRYDITNGLFYVPSSSGAFGSLTTTWKQFLGNPTSSNIYTIAAGAGLNLARSGNTFTISATGVGTNTLTSAHLYVGNSSNVATDTTITGDVTISNTGVTTIKNDVALAGNPTTTTQAANTNNTTIATTAYVTTLVSAASSSSGTSTSNAVTAGNLSKAVPGIIVPADGLLQPLPYDNTTYPYGGVERTTTTTLTNSLHGICTGADGNVWYIANYTKIGKIATDGTGNTEYTTTSAPGAVCTGSDGKIWYAKFSGTKIGKIATDGTGNTEYTTTSTPIVLCAGPDGNIWYTTNNTKIGKITPTGTVTEYSVPTASLYGICAGPDGNIWYTTNATTKIGKITPTGTVTEYNITTVGIDVCTGSDGKIWYSTNGTKIGKIATDGTGNTEYTTTVNSVGITAAPDGNIWFGSGSANLGRSTTSGTVTSFNTTSTTGPVCTGPDGNVWFGTNTNKIGYFSSVVNGTIPIFNSIVAGANVTLTQTATGLVITATASGSGSGTPGGTNGQIQYNNAAVFGGFTASGDATINTGTGAVAVSSVQSAATGTTPSLTDNSTKLTTTAHVFALVAAASGSAGSTLFTPSNFRRWAKWQPTRIGANTTTVYGDTWTITSSTSNNTISGAPAGSIIPGKIHYVYLQSSGANNDTGNLALDQDFTEPQLCPKATFIAAQNPNSAYATGCIYAMWFSPSAGDYNLATTAGPIANVAGFRLNTSAGDTTWQACTSDGTTFSAIDTTITPNATDVPSVFTIDCSSYPTNIKFYIDGVLVVTKTTNLPTTTALWRFRMGQKALSARVIYFGLGGIHLES